MSINIAEAAQFCKELNDDFAVALNKTSLRNPLLRKYPAMSDVDLTAILEEINPSQKRVTFRSRYSDACVALAAKGELTLESGSAAFDTLRDAELEAGRKVSNVDRHRDYYINVYTGFALELLEALNV